VLLDSSPYTTKVLHTTLVNDVVVILFKGTLDVPLWPGLAQHVDVYPTDDLANRFLPFHFCIFVFVNTTVSQKGWVIILCYNNGWWRMANIIKLYRNDILYHSDPISSILSSIKLKIDRTVGVGVLESEFDWRSRIPTEDMSVFITTDQLLKKSTTINFHIDLSVQFLRVHFFQRWTALMVR